MSHAGVTLHVMEITLRQTFAASTVADAHQQARAHFQAEFGHEQFDLSPAEATRDGDVYFVTYTASGFDVPHPALE